MPLRLQPPFCSYILRRLEVFFGQYACLYISFQDNAISRLGSLLADASVTSEELDRKHLLHSAAWMGYDKCTKVP